MSIYSHRVPSVSVVLPAYNMEAYIAAAIESILNQTFKELELILIDDGSTDRTPQIIHSYTDARIIFLQNNNNKGNYPSRNTGIRIARGKYIAVMDADDIASPERLQSQYQYMETHPETVLLGTDFNYDPVIPKMNLPVSHEEIVFSFLEGYTSMLHPSFFIRKSVLQKINGYNESYRYAADYDLACRLSFLGKIENLTEVLMKYRRHPAQISQHKLVEQITYAGEIRKHYQIAFINKYKSDGQSLIEEKHVSYPAMGETIAHYTYARYHHDKGKEQQAEQLLDAILENIYADIPVCLYKGLCGIGCGLIYLLRNQFVEGDEDEILEDLDQTISSCLQASLDNSYYEDQMCYMNYRHNESPV